MEKVGRYVYDIETLSNCYTYTGLNIDSKSEIVQFVIHESRNDLNALISHLNSVKLEIGFNNLNFDAQVNQFILNNHENWLKLNDKLKWSDAAVVIAKEIYNYAQKTIKLSNIGGFPENPEWKLKVPQLDLFRIKHFDNMAKVQSLKGLEFWMNYPNVQDMPINHAAWVIDSDIDTILDYNLNDVKATYEFYLMCKPEIDLRLQLSKEFDLNLLNANDPGIGSEIFAKFLSEDMKIDKKELKKLRTYRKSISLGKIILPYIKFNSTKFNNLLTELKNKTIIETKGSLTNSVIYKGFKYDFGAGGIHGCIKPGIYKAEKGYTVKDIDVSSFYPNLAIVNGFRPEHLGKSFNKIYKYIYDERKKIPKKDPRNAAYKLMLNGVYGKSNSVYSYLYDPEFTMSITINGQLLIAMLAEQLVDITNCEVLQVNTDGITIKYKDEYEKEVNNICNNWCKTTSLELEYAEYNQMVIADVNNYIGVYKNSVYPKYKGLFEISKEPHKDTSFTVIPIALSNYYTKGIAIEDTIRNHEWVYDFCGRAKFRGNDYGEIRYIQNSVELREKQQKTTRYFVSNTGDSFVKIYSDNSEEHINKGYQVTIFNKYFESNNYNINYNFYIKECMKIIDIIENKQLSLF